jgi:diacylglycerol kinase (ATP)
VHELTHQRSGPIHLLSYVLPTLKTLATMKFPTVVAHVDDQRVFSGPAMAVVANLDVYGTGFPMAVHARPDDGLLDLCVLPMRSLFDVVEVAANAFVGEHLLREGVVYARGKSVRIESADRVAVQVDGDAFGFTPLDVRIRPERIPFITPL